MLQVLLAAMLVSNSQAGTSMSFVQNSFEMIYERAELVSFNPEYISSCVIKNFKFNRTQAFSNGTVTYVRDQGTHMKIQVQAYKFTSNEYRDFPILFSYGFCEGLRHNDFGMAKILHCGNMSLAGCPLKKGTYNWCNFAPDSERYPPHIPTGSYMLDIKYFDGPTETLFVQGYGTIKYKNPFEHE